MIAAVGMFISPDCIRSRAGAGGTPSRRARPVPGILIIMDGEGAAIGGRHSAMNEKVRRQRDESGIRRRFAPLAPPA